VTRQLIHTATADIPVYVAVPPCAIAEVAAVHRRVEGEPEWNLAAYLEGSTSNRRTG
jgi:hypothetical protein